MSDSPIAVPDTDNVMGKLNSIVESGVELYRGYELLLKYIPQSDPRYYWFEKAVIINKQATSSGVSQASDPASDFILAYSKYGLLLDSKSSNLAATSDAIAKSVLVDVVNGGAIPIFKEMLSTDIVSALNVGGQTIGGWGGAFYYWNLEYEGSTVGAHIQSNAQELEKFLLSSAVATVSTLSGAGEKYSVSQIIDIIGATSGASLPFELKQEIAWMVADTLETSKVDHDTEHFGKWTYDKVKDEFFWIIPEDAAGAGERVVAQGEEASFLFQRYAYRLSIESKGLNDINIVLAKLGMFHSIPEEHQCFCGGSLILMWPDSRNYEAALLGDEGIHLNFPNAWKKPIEEIGPGDLVLSYDKEGRLKPGNVTRLFRNTATHILDFWGSKVTPGHAYLCAKGRYDGEHIPLMDILREDAAVVRADGVEVRANTGVPVGDPLDGFVQVVVGAPTPEGGFEVRKAGKVRLGSRVILEDGRDFCVADVIAAGGGQVGDDGLIATEGCPEGAPFHWPFGDSLPNPEDYILKRSGVTLAEIYAANEWESGRSRLSAPIQ